MLSIIFGKLISMLLSFFRMLILGYMLFGFKFLLLEEDIKHAFKLTKFHELLSVITLVFCQRRTAFHAFDLFILVMHVNIELLASFVVLHVFIDIYFQQSYWM